MKLLLRIFLALLLPWAGSAAHAAITCTSIASAGFTAGYVNGTTVAVQIQFTITCDRGSTADPASVNYTVRANNGLQSKGVNNFAALVFGGTTYTLGYDLFTTGCAGTQWKGNVNVAGTVSWPPTQTGNATDTQNVWACINNVQTATAAGAYRDSVTVTATYNPGTGATTVTGTIPVAIFAPASCVINPAPGNVSITYPAFAVSSQSGTTTFGATCTVGMPYTLAVAPAAGTLAGVNYTVALSSTASAGTGALQNFTVTVTAPAGQGGICAGASCTASQMHTLTITY